MKGKWRIVKLPGFEPDYADMVEPAYIRFDGDEANVIARPWTTSSTAC